jgi:hypothetical protein
MYGISYRASKVLRHSARLSDVRRVRVACAAAGLRLSPPRAGVFLR